MPGVEFAGVPASLIVGAGAALHGLPEFGSDGRGACHVSNSYLGFAVPVLLMARIAYRAPH